jgi:UDP-glucose 4-epimerase
MLNILVTGASGCSGKGILHYLTSRGYKDVKALVRKLPEDPVPSVEYITGDITDEQRMGEILKENGIEHIWHLAAAVHRSVKKNQFFTINAYGTQKLLEAAKDSGIKTFTYSSTTGVYGRLKETPVKENHRTKPWGVYSKSKLKAEEIIREKCDEFGIAGNILRLPMILGKGDRHVYPVMNKLIKVNLLPLLGNPKHRISIAHPYDIAKAFETVTKASLKNNDIYHVVSCDLTWKELIREMEIQAIGKKRFKYFVPYTIFFLGVWAYEAIHSILSPLREPVINREYAQMVGREWTFDIEKIKKLGFEPIMKKEEIIKDLVTGEFVPVPEEK